MIGSLYKVVCAQETSAADEVLLEVLRLGDADEAAAAAEALLRRKREAGLVGLFAAWNRLPAELQTRLVASADQLTAAAAKGTRHGSEEARAGIAAFVAATRDVRLVYLLAELLRARSGRPLEAAAIAVRELATLAHDRLAADPFAEAVALREALVPVVADALADPRGGNSAAAERELARAAVLLVGAGCRHEGLRKLARARGRGAAFVDDISRPIDAPAAAAAARFHRRVRGTLSSALQSVDQSEALTGLLRCTHLLADPVTAGAMVEVDEERWETLSRRVDEVMNADAASLERDLLRWICRSEVSDASLESFIRRLPIAGGTDSAAKLAVLRAADGRVAGAPVGVLTLFSRDPDPRVARVAVRHLARAARGTASRPGAAPADRVQPAERALLHACAHASATVRRAGSGGLSASFEAYWRRCDRLSSEARISAGRALAKLLGDVPDRLRRLASVGPTIGRLKAIRVASELGLAPAIADAVLAACRDTDAKLRSKAVLVLADVLHSEDAPAAAWTALDAALEDADARVRANAVETLAAVGGNRAANDVRTLLETRGRLGRNRERANALVALSSLRLADVERPLFEMLRDRRDAHRLSALWAVGETRRWRLLDEVVRLARSDENSGIRRSAQAAVRQMASKMRPADSNGTSNGTRIPAVPRAAAAALVVGLTFASSAEAAAAKRASDIAAAFGSSSGSITGEGSLSGTWLIALVMLISGGAALALLVAKLRRWHHARRNTPAAVGRALCRRLGFGRRVRRRLEAMAAEAGTSSVATLLLCPSLLQKAGSQSREARAAADLVLRRLARAA